MAFWIDDVCLLCRSFLGVCSRLQNTLGSFQKVVGESSVPTKDALAQQLIGAIRALNDVRNRGFFIFLLTDLKIRWSHKLKLHLHHP